MKEQHKRFADKYFETLNATQSAIYAGYAEDTAKSEGWRLLQREDIDEYLTNLKADLAEKTLISQQEWLMEWKKLGFSNIQDYMTDQLEAKQLSTVKNPEAIKSIKKTIVSGEGFDKETVEFTLHDKPTALTNIGKHMGWYDADNKRTIVTEQPMFDDGKDSQ